MTFELGVSSTEAITTGAKGRKTIPYLGTIVGWKLVADASTSTVIRYLENKCSHPNKLQIQL
jgi:hypothetical protein